MVLSPHALPYAALALRSLFQRATEPFQLTLITDSQEDKQALAATLQELPVRVESRWSVCSKNDIADSEAERFRNLPNLRYLRHGHPCWRKITDPLLLSSPGDEMIVLDPDLYFPNSFTFEPTPHRGLLLMWQQPNCLYPPETVQRAFHADVALARHVDIGVAHWRGELDLEWLDRLVSTLGGNTLPRSMHVEAILWSAIAMRTGGGHLDPSRWVCWRRTQTKRVRAKLGAQARLLHAEPWQQMKCFHAGGQAKWWLADALQELSLVPQQQLAQTPTMPFMQLTRRRYACEQSAKRTLRSLGYYRVFDQHSQ